MTTPDSAPPMPNFTLRLPPDLRRAITRIALRRHIPDSIVLRQIINEWLVQHGEIAPSQPDA